MLEKLWKPGAIKAMRTDESKGVDRKLNIFLYPSGSPKDLLPRSFFFFSNDGFWNRCGIWTWNMLGFPFVRGVAYGRPIIPLDIVCEYDCVPIMCPVQFYQYNSLQKVNQLLSLTSIELHNV